MALVLMIFALMVIVIAASKELIFVIFATTELLSDSEGMFEEDAIPF